MGTSFGLRGEESDQREIAVGSRYSSGLRQNGLTLLAVVALGLLPASAEAAGLAFRNDTDGPILVQGVSIVNRVARRGKLHVLRPGEVSRELILVPSTIVIRVADANQSTRSLCEKAIQFTGTDLFFAIKVEEPEKAQEGDQASAKAKEQKAVPLKVKLVLVKPTPPVSPPPTPRR